MSHHIATSEQATSEQIEFSEFIVLKLVAYNKLHISLKNIWKNEIIEVLVETCCNPYPNLYDEIKTYCKEKDFTGYGVEIIQNHLRAKIKKDKTVQGEEATQSLREYFISSSDEAKEDIIIRCLNLKKGWLPDFTRTFIRQHNREFRTKVNNIRRTYINNEDDEKLSDMKSIFSCYSEIDKLACVKSFLATVLGQIPKFYLDFINYQSEDVKEELRGIRAELINKKR